jgi:hypothetical protein
MSEPRSKVAEEEGPGLVETGGATDSVSASARFARSPYLPVLVVVAAVVGAHLPYLLGVFDPNPMKPFSGLVSGIHSGVLPGNDTIDPNTGFTSQTFSHRAALDWLHGSVPWWNPAEGLGTPLAGTMKGMAMFLPFVLLLRFQEGQIALYLVFDLIAALSTYFLLRRLAVRTWVCAAAAIAFGLNGTMAWNRYAAADPVCFLPLVILGLELIRDGVRTGRPTRWWFAAIALAMSVYAGFPETTYLDGVVILVWALARLSGLHRQEIRRYLTRVGSVGVVGLCISAPVLTALVDYLPNSFVGGHNGGYAHATMPRIGLSNLMFPYIYGPIFGYTRAPLGGSAVNRFWSNTGGYLTAATVFLALLGLYGRRERILKLCLAGTAVVVIGRTFGIGIFLDLFNLLPGMTHVAVYRYSYPAFEFCVIALAAFGLDALVRKELDWTRVTAAFAIALFLALFAFLRGRPLTDALKSAPGANAWANASLLWGFGTIGLLLIAAVLPRAVAGRIVLVGLLPVEAIAMFVTPEFSTPRGGTIDLSVVAFLQQNTGLDRVYTLGPLEPNYGSYFGINSLNADDLPVPKAFNRLIQTQLDPNTSSVYFTGTKVSNRKGITPEQALSIYLPNYERVGVKYVLVASGAPDPVGSPKLALAYHDHVVDVYALPHPRQFYSTADGACSFGVMTFSQVAVHCAAPATVTRNELEMPGWSAQLHGHSIPIRSDGDGLESVTVPAGDSTLTFSFQPPHTGVAAALAVLGLLLCAGSGWASSAVMSKLRPLGRHGPSQHRRRRVLVRSRRRSPSSGGAEDLPPVGPDQPARTATRTS